MKATAHDDRATTYLSAPPAAPVTPTAPTAAVTPASTPTAAMAPALLPVNPLIVILNTPLIAIPAKSEDFRDLHVRPYLFR